MSTIYSMALPKCIRSRDQSPRTSNGHYGLNSLPNISICSSTDSLTCRRQVPGPNKTEHWTIQFRTYTTPLSNSRISVTWQNSCYLATQRQKVPPKFLASSISVPDTIQGGKLFRVMAERLVEFAPNWRNSVHYEGAIHRAVTTLFMLVFAAKGHPIPENTKTQLVNWLQIWAAYKSWSPGSMMPGDDLPRACHSLSGVLSRPVALKSIIKQQRRALKCIEVCGLPTCDAETKLKVCSR
jgi:hypothetical protein